MAPTPRATPASAPALAPALAPRAPVASFADRATFWANRADRATARAPKIAAFAQLRAASLPARAAATLVASLPLAAPVAPALALRTTPGAATRADVDAPNLASVIVRLVPNPKRSPGSESYEAWVAYQDGMTVAAYFATVDMPSGGRFAKGKLRAALKFDRERGYVALMAPADYLARTTV